MKTFLLALTMAVMLAVPGVSYSKVLYNSDSRQNVKEYYYKDKVEVTGDYVKVKTQSLVDGGSVEYRIWYHLNCKTLKYTMTSYWSSGFGWDNGLMVDGKWWNIRDYPELVKLKNKVCPEIK